MKCGSNTAKKLEERFGIIMLLKKTGYKSLQAQSWFKVLIIFIADKIYTIHGLHFCDLKVRAKFFEFLIFDPYKLTI
jgi:hypothetical protein